MVASVTQIGLIANALASCDKYATGAPASSNGVDSFNQSYTAGDILVTLPSGQIICVTKTVDTDTFANATTATGPGVDAFGQAYQSGDKLLDLPNGATVCIPAKGSTGADTYAVPSTATIAGLDSFGVPYNIGDIIVTYPDGSVLCQSKVTDTVSTAAVATATGVDTSGDPIAVGDEIITIPGYGTICVPKKVDVSAAAIPFPGYDDPTLQPGDSGYGAPATPAVPDVFHTTCDPLKGVNWSWSPANQAWSVCSFSPACQNYSANTLSTEMDNDALQAWFDGGTDSRLVEQLCLTITNNDCLPAVVTWGHRYLHKGSKIQPGTVIDEAYIADNNGAHFGAGVNGWGTASHIYDNDCGACPNNESIAHIEPSINRIVVPAGFSGQACVSRYLAISTFASGSGQELNEAAWILTAKLERCLELN